MYKPNPRQYVAAIPQIPGLEVWFQRASDVVRKLRLGDIDLGIVGFDMFEVGAPLGGAAWRLHRSARLVACVGERRAGRGRARQVGSVWGSGHHACSLPPPTPSQELADGDPDLVVVHEALNFGHCHLALGVPMTGKFAHVERLEQLRDMPWTAQQPLRVVTGVARLGRLPGRCVDWSAQLLPGS